jgi:catechol 2,3-dioxygenase-like lactoylglutathione lyase family enzyme
MKALAMVLLAFPCVSVNAQTQPSRPPIVGIGSVRIALTQPPSFVKFYLNELGLGGGPTVCKGASRTCIELNKNQRIDLSTPGQPVKSSGMLNEVDFETTDLPRLHSFMIARGQHPEDIVETPGANLCFSVGDPEGHRVGFIQYLKQDNFSHPENQISTHLIHAGFVVRDRAAEDRFYKDVLGFHVYWHGGMKEGEDNWVDMQVPDGTDWIEYMLKVPENATHKQLGVMNHIALGVPDIHAAQQQLIKNGWKGTEEPKIGRDGKWQLNLYDPDETRVELMEFKPTKEPCCAPYSGPHPGAQ